MRWDFCAAFLLGVAGSAHVAVAADLVVQPGQSIQAAIQSAANGDRILIQPGTYFEHSIDFKGKALELIGVGGAAATILDGGDAVAANVLCQSSTAVTMRVEGLTLRNCLVGIHAATPGTVTIRACVIEDHHSLGLQGLAADAGHGIFVEEVGANSLIVDCVVRDNEGSGVEGPVDISRCVISGNLESGVVAPRNLRECRIINNVGPQGGGVRLGHNLVFGMETQVIDRCDISSNHATNGGGVSGGGGMGVLIQNSRIVGNTASAAGGGIHFYVLNSSKLFSVANAWVRNCVIADNVALGGGGAWLYALAYSTPFSGLTSFERCTISGNTPDGVYMNSPTRVLKNCVVWNQPNAVTGFGTLTITYTDFEGGHPGMGNFNLDPQFVDPANQDYHLRSTSPCIDVGNGTSTSDFEGDATSGLLDVGGDEFAPHLALTGDPSPGGTVRLGVYGKPGTAPVLFFIAATRLDTGIALPFGTFGLGVPLIAGFPLDLGPIPSSSAIAFPAVIPPTAPVGVSLHMQAFLGAPEWRLTNVESFVVG